MVTMLCWLDFDIVPLQLWVRLHLECEGGGGSKVEPCNLRLGKPGVSVLLGKRQFNLGDKLQWGDWLTGREGVL